MTPCPICAELPCVCERPGQQAAAGQWYLSAKAVRQYMAICGYPRDDDGPGFDRAAKELQSLARQSRLAQDIDAQHDTQRWRIKTTIRGGKRSRLELIVSCAIRQEGDLPQLICVLNKGA